MSVQEHAVERFAAAAAPQAAHRRLPSSLAAILSSAALPPLAVALLTSAVFAPTLLNDFVEWDDSVNLIENPSYRGLGWAQLRWMFTTALMGHWIPLSWLTLGLDYVLWGMNPAGYHLTNVLLHAAATTTLYFAARRLLTLATGVSGPPLLAGAATAALFFGIHPLRAESVAWVTERRDVLSGFLFLATVLLYLRAAAEPARRRAWLGAAVATYALAAMAKSMVVTLPAVLLLLDVYPLRRLPWRPRVWLRPEHRPVLLEKLPFAGIALICAAMALWAITVANSYLTPLERLPVGGRIAAVLYGLAFYASRTLVPLGLSPLHEMPATVDPFEPRFVLSAVAVLGATLILVALSRRWPGGLTAWTAYGIMVAPVNGLLHNGHQLVHDRYSYLPTLGFALLVGGGVASALGGALARAVGERYAKAFAGTIVLALVGLGVLAGFQARIWRDTDTLWRYAIEFEPTCSICYHNLGLHLLRRGLAEQAVPLIERAIALRPDRVKFHDSLGLALLGSGRAEAAIAEFQKVLTIYPGDARTLSNLSGALLTIGRSREGLATAVRAVQHDEQLAEARINLALALLESGWPHAALAHLGRALELKPGAAQAYAALVRAQLAVGEHEAARHAHAALREVDARLAARLAPWLDAAR